MKRVRISGRADGDLDAILRYGLAQFGAASAVRYYNSLTASFGWIADHPRASRLREWHGHGIRFHLVGSHRVVYRIEEDSSIFVIRVLHGQQDPSRHLKP